ncbi:hypothetical protein DTO013E5_7824 [Penicillium roqueforti]|uniref:DUF1989 domain-containing protein n=1 Tax=Penicillium nordicum TaxID=229535 RepID=A0A0M8NWG3_9EURO|nr:hypothetical protein LCP963914a_6732 [Penicillium roqueforti]KAJ5695350.1 hypothetical protein N7536_005762 [Penicillium majusculum]KAJ5878279.1 hypothetical protein N7455_001744 [Penicillium solitum]KOS36294.1 hypothetical protein ACN38_g12974 [Penicillium nordicum]KAI2737219.1 hypothetical protein DTO012A1_7847 [Penicillium roqueforti]
MPTIPARRFAMQRLNVGQSIKIIDSSGGQVIDTWAFSLPSTPAFPRYMSMTHTRSTLHKLLPSIHESFLDNKRDPILTIAEDTSPGIHDVLYAACSPERYLQLGADKEHDNCANNLHDAIQQCTEPSFSHIMNFLESGWMPDPLNLFMKVDINGTNLQCLNPESKAGDYIVLKAEQECVVIMSACPMDLSACNGSEPSSANFEVV